MPPAISILLPTFNGARYLRAQLDSIVAQTFGDWELLAIDDGSSDDTVAILREYAARDPRITLLPSEGNRRQKARLVELLRLARGKWIAISDQDDIWAADKLERLVAAIGDAALAFGRSDLIDSDGRPFGRDLLRVLRSSRRPDDRLLTIFRPQISGHAMIAVRDVMPESVFASDEPFDWLIGLLAEFSRGIVYDHQAVVQHRLHAANSHNDTIALRINPLLLRPRHFLLWLERINRSRERLMAAIDLLAHSEVVRPEARAAFGRLHRVSRRWVASGGKRDRAIVRMTALRELRPLAGSIEDFRRAARSIDVAVLGEWHPRVLLKAYKFYS
ncbi:glycosyltransferase [Tsuneonella sp. SYSU-LHT278]|uniref:glycosyltransferase n=1 Tax=Tsuneonella sediminis TaxID=3416089 RepID=UPI003F7B0CCB